MEYPIPEPNELLGPNVDYASPLTARAVYIVAVLVSTGLTFEIIELTNGVLTVLVAGNGLPAYEIGLPVE